MSSNDSRFQIEAGSKRGFSEQTVKENVHEHEEPEGNPEEQCV